MKKTLMPLIFVLSTATGWAARCTDQPLRVYVYPTATMPDGVTTVPSAITNDGNWYDASIQYCSGTYDAVLNLLVSKRKLRFTFPSPIPNSTIQEDIPAGTYSVNGFINVRNILCVGCSNPHQPFTTRVGTQFEINRTNYTLRFMPLSVDAPDLHQVPDLGRENRPFSGSAAQVIPQPYDCLTGGTVKPAWVVRGALPNNDSLTPAGYNLQVGTAYKGTASASPHAGQYQMPFEFRLEALQCFAY
ncbi:MAG: hypothetical protein HY820_41780 [Acidobacteria bacterium]|nr:hypothetical protein [Acidobacteriota bacterium]